MVSIITAIYNQLDMNRLFWKYLQKYTDNKFELIIIDNGSTDGSREFFQSLAANEANQVKVIANDANYSYPYCQNQGIEVAQYDMLAFLNNDILVAPHWDSRMLQILGRDNRDILSIASNDRLSNKKSTKHLSRRWKYIKYPIIYLFGQKKFALKLMAFLCYGNWEKYTENIFSKYGFSFTPGFSGSAIIMNRRGLSKVGKWDLSQQGADYDIFFRTYKRSEEVGDIMPLSIVNGIFHHHYRRLTLYSKFPPFADKHNLISFEQKWDKTYLDKWMGIMKFKY